MGRKVLAGLIGVIVAFFTVWLVQKLGHMVYPPPTDLDPADTEAFGAFVESLPVAALLFVIASYFIGAFDGTFVAALIARDDHYIYPALVGGVVLIATTMNLILIPHPTWFAVTAIIAIVVASWLGLKLSRTVVPKGTS